MCRGVCACVRICSLFLVWTNVQRTARIFRHVSVAKRCLVAWRRFAWHRVVLRRRLNAGCEVRLMAVICVWCEAGLGWVGLGWSHAWRWYAWLASAG